MSITVLKAGRAFENIFKVCGKKTYNYYIWYLYLKRKVFRNHLCLCLFVANQLFIGKRRIIKYRNNETQINE